VSVIAEPRGSRFEVPTSQTNFVWRPLREQVVEFAVHFERAGDRAAVLRRPWRGVGGDRVPAENEQVCPRRAAGPGPPRGSPA